MVYQSSRSRRGRTAPSDDAGAGITLLDVVRFASEIALFGGVVRLVVDTLASQPVLLRYLVALVPVGLIAVLWGRFLAPTAPHRIVGARRLVAEVVLFGAVALLLVVRDHPVWAAVLVLTWALGQLAVRRRELRGTA